MMGRIAVEHFLGEPRLPKAEIVNPAGEILTQCGLTQAVAARIMGRSQPDIPKMLRGPSCRFN